MNHYIRFSAMIATSTITMFCLMYLNTYTLDHVFFSETRTYMALYMGGAMAIIMLLFMLNMYQDKRKNTVIFSIAGAIFVIGIFLVRSQITVEDESWMKAMIPHHSIAVLTSERATIKDVRVRELANGIIKTQRKEIKEMEWLIEDIKKNGRATTKEAAMIRPVPTFKGTLSE